MHVNAGCKQPPSQMPRDVIGIGFETTWLERDWKKSEFIWLFAIQTAENLSGSNQTFQKIRFKPVYNLYLYISFRHYDQLFTVVSAGGP